MGEIKILLEKSLTLVITNPKLNKENVEKDSFVHFDFKTLRTLESQI